MQNDPPPCADHTRGHRKHRELMTINDRIHYSAPRAVVMSHEQPIGVAFERRKSIAIRPVREAVVTGFLARKSKSEKVKSGCNKCIESAPF